jgi:hypothetical protein
MGTTITVPVAEPVDGPAAAEPVVGFGDEDQAVTDDLIDRARTIVTDYRTAAGRDITRDQLRAQLRVSNAHRRRTATPDPRHHPGPAGHHRSRHRTRSSHRHDRRPPPMTNPVSTATGSASAPPRPRRGSRAARLAHPTMTAGVRQIAVEHGVCIRPVLLRMTNEATGQTDIIEQNCGSTRDKQCPQCAQRAKKLRQAQCREGWHRTTEPVEPAAVHDDETGLILVRANLEYARPEAQTLGRFNQVAKVDAAIVEVEQMMTAAGLRGTTGTRKKGEQPRRKRSTRRRQDAPKLPP